MEPMSTELAEAAPAAVVPDQEAEQSQTAEVATPEQEAAKPDDESKPEKTPEQRTIERMQRRIDRLTAKGGSYEAELRALKEARQAMDPEDEQTVEQKAQAKAREIVESQRLQEKAASMLKTGEKLGGFREAVAAVAEEVPLFEASGKPSAFLREVLDCDNPAAVLKHLGEHPDMAEELANLSQTQVARRLAKLEVQLEEAAKVKPSAAPKPLTPVKGAKVESGLSSELSIEEWMARREQQVKGKRGL